MKRLKCAFSVWIGAALPTILLAVALTALFWVTTKPYRGPPTPNPRPAPIWFWSPINTLVRADPYYAGTYRFWLLGGFAATFVFSLLATAIVDTAPASSIRSYWRRPLAFFAVSIALGVILAWPWIMGLCRFLTILPP